MKFGVNAFIWAVNYDGLPSGLLPRLRDGGFDGVELSMFDPGKFPATAIRRESEASGLEVTICSVMTGGLSAISEDPYVRQKTRDHLRACAAAAAGAGAKLIAGPLYSPVGYLPGRRRTEDEWKWAVECYQEVGPALAQAGVTIAIEPLNRFETYFLNTTADGAKLCDEIGHPNVGLLIDTFHCNVEEKNVPQAYRTAAKHLKHVHTCENDRGTPGTGHVDWPGVFQALRDVQYDGWLTIESFGFALGELSAAASIWRDIEKTPEEIAFEGIKFLKKNVATSVAAH